MDLPWQIHHEELQQEPAEGAPGTPVPTRSVRAAVDEWIGEASWHGSELGKKLEARQLAWNESAGIA